VDNTFSSPILQRPLELGAHLVMHSATKYLNGHSDMVGGMLVVGDDAELAEQMTFLQNAVGGVQGPVRQLPGLRGLKTLHLRMKAHCETRWSSPRGCRRIRDREGRVPGPGLASAARTGQAPDDGYGGMVSVWLKGGEAAARRVMERTELFACAESLGGVESLVNHPAIMTHASVPPSAAPRSASPTTSCASRGRRGRRRPARRHRGRPGMRPIVYGWSTISQWRMAVGTWSTACARTACG
jgi:cystathionine gamma-lyase